jgi:Rps23 Pro-64 3,4-dihydroxylase Tpa1-like proline 4-hydroxylase
LIEAECVTAWQSSSPFPHLVIDNAATDPEALLELLEEESVARYESDLFVFEATPPEPRGDELKRVRAAFASAYCGALSRITGTPVSTIDMRAYAYRPGHYLLPHTDHQDNLERRLAYAYYLPSPDAPAGGELELFEVAMDGDEFTTTTSAKLIEPVANRLAIFEVGDRSLHQVREVLGGLRLSLAGWFYP